VIEPPSVRRPVTRPAASVLCVLGVLLIADPAQTFQEPPRPQSVPAAQLQAEIDKLGDLDDAVRTNASRIVRRTPAAQAVPALIQTVSDHGDGYVRYRALVLLIGFNDPRSRDVMHEAMTSPNDRLRTVAYSYYEHNPDRAAVADLLAAMDKEQGEFVRPSLVRALAAAGAAFDDPRVRQALIRESGRGQDFFRSAVIEALGDYHAQYAVDALLAIARLEGPLQDDTAVALGKIGDRRALETLAGLQRTAPKESQPYIAAGICLLGVNCASHEDYLINTLKFADRNAGFQTFLRAAAAGLGDLAVAGHPEAIEALFDVGVPARDEVRAPVALALATAALRNTPQMLAVLGGKREAGAAFDQAQAIELLAEGFDMLEEDVDKERFFARVRRTYWSEPEGSAVRALMQTLIGKLDF
jgi:hypothetical protein